MRKTRAKQTSATDKPIETTKWEPDIEANQVDLGTTSDGDVYLALSSEDTETAIALAPADALDLARRIYAIAFLCLACDAGQAPEDGNGQAQ